MAAGYSHTCTKCRHKTKHRSKRNPARCSQCGYTKTARKPAKRRPAKRRGR